MKEKVCSVGGCRARVPAHQAVCENCYRRKLERVAGPSDPLNTSIKEKRGGGRMKSKASEEDSVRNLVWRLVFRELSNEEMLELAYEVVLCSLMDSGCRERALEALGEVARSSTKKPTQK